MDLIDKISEIANRIPKLSDLIQTNESKVFILAVCMIAIGSNVAFSEVPTRIICNTDNPKDSMQVLTFEKFDELLRKYSNGKLFAEIHYRGSVEFPAIRGEEVTVNLVMTGKKEHKTKQPVHIGQMASGNAALRVHVLEFLMLPYLFPEAESAKKLFRSDLMKNEINQITAEKHNVRSIGWLIGGFRHMTNSKRPVKRLAEIKGLSIRIPRNRLMVSTYKKFGAIVKPLDWGLTFNALKDGEIDGQENPYNVILYSKFWEARQKYITNNGPFLWSGPLLMNEKFYQSLSPELQEAVNRAGLEACEYEWDWIDKENDSFKKQLVDKGMQILELEDKPKWIEATRSLYEQYYSQIGYRDYEKGKELVDKILKITRSISEK